MKDISMYIFERDDQKGSLKMIIKIHTAFHSIGNYFSFTYE